MGGYMSESLTYSSLISDVELYAERSDTPFIDQLPRFVMLAENRLSSEFKGLGYLRVVNFNTIVGQPVYEKPARWRQTHSLSLLDGTSRKYLFQRSYEYCREFWPVSSSVDIPSYFADYDYEHLFLAATPDSTYQCELMYYERPLPLSIDNQVNWTTQYAPQLLLYATLLEAQPFLKNPARAEEFQKLYDRAAKAISLESASSATVTR
jgi:hypothetical protein